MRRSTISRHVVWLLLALVVAPGSRAAADEAGIYVMNTDGGGQRHVVSIDGAVSHTSPRWSHDGQRLAFEAVFPGGVYKSYVVNLDGTQVKQVSDLRRPDWSPDDKQLVLDDDDWRNSKIFVQNVDGGGRTELTEGAWPRWSPDGSKIAFCDGSILKVLDLAAGEEYALCAGRFVQRPGSFDWSRDGKRLALFTRSVADGPRELYIIDAKGGNADVKPRYSRPGRVGAHVTWSPDDKQLFFTIESVIHVLDVAGNGAPRLVGSPTDENRDPAVSPDGKQIAFARRPFVAPR